MATDGQWPSLGARSHTLCRGCVFLCALWLAPPAGATETVATAPISTECIVSVGGAITEIFFTLGAGERLVGIDTTSHWPPAVEAPPEVGYQRSPSAACRQSAAVESSRWMAFTSSGSGPAQATPSPTS